MMRGRGGAEEASRRAFGAFLADLRSPTAVAAGWRNWRRREGTRQADIDAVEEGKEWPSDAILRTYALATGHPYAELVNLRDRLIHDPRGPVAEELDATLFERKWARKAPRANDAPAKALVEGRDSVNSVWELASVLATKPRTVEKVYLVVPWVLAFWIVAISVLSGAPSHLPTDTARLANYPTQFYAVLTVVSLVVGAIAGLLSEYGMRYVLVLIRKAPGIRGAWRDRNDYFNTRAVPVMVESLRRAGELKEVESAGAAAEVLERLAVILPLSGLLVLGLVRQNGDPSAYWTVGLCIVSPAVTLPLSVAAVRHALLVTKHAVGDD
jgi:hypothetical protein